MLDLLLDSGADVEGGKGGGAHPLQLAVWAGSGESVRLLLNRGASANAVGLGGRTALHLCACTRDEQVTFYIPTALPSSLQVLLSLIMTSPSDTESED